jgi:hypothetical protein
MTQLTEERFEQILEQKLKGLATTAGLEKAVAPLATKEDVREGVEELARMVSAGFDDIRDRLDVRERVSRVEHNLQRIAKELHINL